MQRFPFVAGRLGRRVFAPVLALSFVTAACGGDEDCSVTDSCPNQRPTVTITAPATGASVDEFTSVSFQGSATDAEDGSLTGSSLVWTSSIDGAIGTGASFSRTDLSPGSHTITLTATDSDGGTGSASVTLTVVDVANEAPEVTITQPADGGSASSGANVTFSGTAADLEDGNLTGAALVWTSDLDGPIGTGTSFSTSSLSGGTHEIVLTATDSEGAFGADTIDFSITGAPTVTISAPVDQASGAPNTVTVGTSVTFTGSATDAEDGPLTGASLVWSSNVDGQIGTGESFSTTALTAGMHTVTLTATDSEANESKATVLTIVKPPNAAGYQIHIRWSEGVELTAAQRTAVADAVTKLQAVITGDVPNVPPPLAGFPDVGTCGGAAIPKMDEGVDDVIIYLEFAPIDGPGNTLGSAGPCFTRTNTAQSLIGGMRFDSEDLEFIDSVGLLEEIIIHEMLHVLGFGIFWEGGGLPFDYLEQPSDPSHPDHNAAMKDTHFDGPMALDAFADLGGGSYTGGEIVPVENDDSMFGTGSLDGHWRESVFDEELMTTAANVGVANPLSELTIGSLEDIGYTVDYGAADPYTQVFSIVLPDAAASAVRATVDLSGDVWRGPIHAVEPDGSARLIR